ncbi:MAG: hypothetical protein G01um101470_896, partial [Parcubacteria group bacterium Gr01-1014_70]
MRPEYKENEQVGEHFKTLRDGTFFSVNVPAYQGDSGSVVAAFDSCGKPAAVGLAFAYISGNANAWLVVIRSEAI